MKISNKYPYEIKYTKQNIWVWVKPNLGYWKLNKEQIKKINCEKLFRKNNQTKTINNLKSDCCNL